MDILIRPWRRDDLPAVRRILWGSWMAAYSPFIPVEDLHEYFEATYRIDSLARLFESPRIHGFIGEADGEAAGFARTQFHARENRLYLASLYLLPAYQGMGIGGRLLEAAEGRALAYGLKELWVGVMTRNEAAGRWYGKRGFRFVKEEPFRMGKTTVPHQIGYKPLAGSGGDGEPVKRPFAVFDKAERPFQLAALAGSLCEHQKKTWPLLTAGVAALQGARMREIPGEGTQVRVQFNPGRMTSSAAPVDPEAIRRRPCFLCTENLPPEQEWILYREEYHILCNPAPLLPAHFTIAHRRHLPQSISGRLETFLTLAEDFGPRMVVLYNGPRCGASAPDHLHFHAASAGHLPVETRVPAAANRATTILKGGAEIFPTRGLWCGAVVIGGRERPAVAAAADGLIAALGRLTGAPEEPLLNLIGSHTGEKWRLILFPRLKHRPDAYFREGAERLLVSPGAVDMAGLLITPREEDFLKLDPGRVREIFREVAFDEAAVEALLASLPS
jgi:ribosomal protein S18 acetylase RimI-like enzyme